MRRRDFIMLLGGATVAWPLAAHAQQPELPIVGFLSGGSSDSRLMAAIRQGLGESGYFESKNVTIEYSWANGQYDRLPAMAADLVRRQVTVIATTTPVAALAAKQATTSIPIVFALGSDPVKDGLVASLNRPGGNVTGATFFGNLLAAKRTELLHQLVADAKVFAVLLNPKNANVELEESDTQQALRALGLQLILVQASTDDEIDKSFSDLQGATALLVSGDVRFYDRSKQIAELAVRHSIATCFPYREQAVAGGLMSYGADITDTFRQAGNYVGRILKGEKPADLPVQQSTRFELVINLKTAKALGLTIPPTVLARADEVIE
jgi:putative tryptophan/tyrosine transport system substrate-binding protein